MTRLEINYMQRFGRLRYLGEALLRGESRRRRILCLCDCGIVKSYEMTNVRIGHTKSCGCTSGETRRKLVGGIASRSHPLYETWASMIARCENPNKPHYHRYGGRGITVCKEWHDFREFAKDMSPRPEGQSLDRIDNDKGYSSKNCRWASLTQQARNTRKTTWITSGGETLCSTTWSLRLGGGKDLVLQRIRSGWSEQKAISTPVRRCAHHKTTH